MTEEATIDLQSHIVIVGRSSSGKTYFFREAIWKPLKMRGVFVNTQREAGFEQEVTHWDMRRLYLPGAKVNLCGPLISAKENGNKHTRDTIARVVDDCIKVGDKVAKDRRGRVLICVDEAHLFSPKGSQDDPLQRISTNGNRFGIKGCFITQRPALLSHTVLSQASVHVLFDLDDYERPYLEKYAVPDDVQAWITQPRHFAMRVGKDWHKCLPVGS